MKELDTVGYGCVDASYKKLSAAASMAGTDASLLTVYAGCNGTVQGTDHGNY